MEFEDLLDGIDRWASSHPTWPPARRIAADWAAVGPRLGALRQEIAKVLVVGVVGGTGTGKSTLVNALAGSEVSAAGDVARPMTKNPVVVAGRGVDCSWLPIEAWGARLVRSDAPAVADIVLVDCPDPDTQAADPDTGGPKPDHPPRPSDANHNRDLLERVLPECDVLLLVSTAQKYRSWMVAREVQAFAPGRPMLFVQTHASRDVDIREDWRRELHAQGFDVPRIHRLDGVEASRRLAAGLPPEEGFAELVASIETELAGRAARRVRRTGAIDLVEWFLRQSAGTLDGVRKAVDGLAKGLAAETSRLEKVLAAGLARQLAASSGAWQRLLVGDIVAGWHGGPFTAFLRTVSAVEGLWPRIRSAGGGIVGRVLAGRDHPAIDTTRATEAIGEIGLAEADIEQSRSILGGLAARARITEPLVGRARLDPVRAGEAAADLLSRTQVWLSRGIAELSEGRRGRGSLAVTRLACELLFSCLLVAVLWRAGWSFFHDRLWAGKPTDTGSFLWESIFWLAVCGFGLRWVVFLTARRGLDRDIESLVARLPEAHCVDPVLGDFSSAVRDTTAFLATGDRLAAEMRSLTTTFDGANVALGRLRRDPETR